MRRISCALLALMLACSMAASAFAVEAAEAERAARGLQALGLFLGDEGSFELERSPTRLESVILLLRLLGYSDEELRKDTGVSLPFDDVPNWARGYVACARSNGLVSGAGDGFRPDEPATEQMFAAFVLRALGYVDDTRGGTDFAYADAVGFAASLGLPTGTTRGDCVLTLTAALSAATKDGVPLWKRLAETGAFTEREYRAFLARAEEPEDWKKPAEGAPAYQSLYPDFYAPQSFRATEEAEKTAYLTFDDGPSERTDAILDTLSEKQVKATFFVVGHADAEDLDRMRRIAAQGHTIGMHSYSHDYNRLYASVEGFLEDFYRNFNQIREVTGVTPTAFRFPGGSVNSRNKAVRKALIAEMERRGFVPYDWNVTSGDAAPNGARVDEVFGNIVNQSSRQDRVIVLCHDSEAKLTTVQALPGVIDDLRQQGFRFAPIAPTTKPYLF